MRRSIEASEPERTRWARELHDETLQQLAGLSCCSPGPGAADEANASGARSGGEQIDCAIGDLRALITDLRPAALDELGPSRRSRPSSNAWRASRTDGRARHRARVRGRREPTRLPREIEVTLYRLVQEALTNVVKHAGHARGRHRPRARGNGRGGDR